MRPSQGHYLHAGQHKHRINAYTDIHASNGNQTHGPAFERAKAAHALDIVATVIGTNVFY
jgi:hypothetical protein